MNVTVEGLYVGQIKTLEPDGERSAIFKHPVDAVTISTGGIEGDAQADTRFHGGPDKAVHQFSQDSYRVICERYPLLSDSATYGSFGENLSATNMTDSNVHIGDIYHVGSTVLQVSEPRRPCWKINRKFGQEKLSVFVEQQCISGWYFRVLQDGEVRVGDAVSLQQRQPDSVSIAEFTSVITQHRPSLSKLDQLVAGRGLSELWRRKLQARRDYLTKLGA